MSQWLFHIDRKISYRKKSSACSDIFSVSRSKLQPQGRSIVKDQERMVQLECTNIKKGRVLEIRPRILGQTSFQLHDTVAPGWFSMIDRVSSQDFLHMVSHLYLYTAPGNEPSGLFIGCLEDHSPKMSNPAYSENLYLGRHLQSRYKAPTLGNSEIRIKH